MNDRLSMKLLAAALFLYAATGPVIAGVTAVYTFDAPSVEEAGDGFSRLVFPSTMQAGKPGEPAFPFRGAAILLPPGQEAASVRVERRGWKVIGRTVRLRPMQDPVPGLEAPAGGLRYSADVYATDAWIHPPDPGITTRYLRGHAVATAAFSPAGHNPATGEAGYYGEIEITVETRRAVSGAPSGPRLDEGTVVRLAGLVDNPEAVPAADTAAPDGGPDYLIIVREAYADGIAPLRDHYTARGMQAGILTVEEIDMYYSGADLAEEIRLAITDAYLAGATHVLLAGDSDGGPNTLPHRGLYCTVQSSSVYTDGGIPADLYYAALDGDWNSDGDSLYGEPGEEDLYSEVAVGRISFDDGAELDAIVSKIISYQDSPVTAQCDDALMIGEHLWSDPLTYGGDEMDQLIGYWDIHGFATTGIPPSFDIVKLYERDITYGETDIRDAINAGTHLLCHAGHSNYGYVMLMTTSDITTSNFTNDGAAAGFPVINSYGCNAGGFDLNDCIAEEMVSLETCASAYVGNSRYGWFHEGTTNGPSHHFQREFFDAIFTEGITCLGDALVRSKDETVPFVDLPDEYEPGAHRWCFYCLNLLGDPAMDVWTGQPAPISASHEPGVARGSAGFEVETGIEGSIGALYADGTCYGTGTAGPDGSMTILLADTVPGSVDSLVLTVRGHDLIPYRSTVAVTDFAAAEGRAPALALCQNSPNPFNPTTTIRFTLSSGGSVDLRAYDVAGREAAVIVSETMETGAHEVSWNASGLASGVYFYVLRAEGRTISRKAVLLR